MHPQMQKKVQENVPDGLFENYHLIRFESTLLHILKNIGKENNYYGHQEQAK